MPSRGVLVSVLLGLALIGTVLVASLGSDQDSASPSGPDDVVAGTPTPTRTAPSAPVEVTPDEFCARFLTFVDANSTFAADLDEASGRALVEASRSMDEISTPRGMTDGARAALDQLVEGTLSQLSSVPEVEVDPAPIATGPAEPDPAALDRYLQAVCPA